MTRGPARIGGALLLAAAVASSLAAQSGSRDRQGFRAELTDRQTHVLRVAPDGTLALSNIVGAVEVRAGSGPDVRVVAVRQSRGRTEADARRGLEMVTAQVTERGNRTLVEASHPPARNPPYAVTVSYDVTAPAGTNLTIQSVTGHVEVAGIAGELSIDTTTGAIEVRDAPRLARARTATGSVELTNVGHDASMEAGTIAGSVEIAGVRAPRLRVDTVTGQVHVRDADVARVEIATTQGEVQYAGRVVAGGHYELRTHAGAVRFEATGGSGFALQAQTFAGRIVPSPDLGLTVTRRSRRDLTGTVGDGRATVQLTTFSGEVTIGRR